MTIFILIITLLCPIASGLATYKGNLLYYQQTEAAVTVNPQLVNFHRRFDTRMLDTCIDTLDKFGEAYNKFCDHVTQIKDSEMRFTTVGRMYYRFANAECGKFNTMLPEVRNLDHAKLVMEEMKNQALTIIYAGVAFSNGKMVYLSDNDNISYKLFIACPTCPITNSFTQLDLNHLNTTEEYLEWFYEIAQSQLVLTPHINQGLFGSKYKVICQVKDTVKETMLTTLAKHSCIRDKDEVLKTNMLLRQEVSQFKSPRRHKRHIGLAFGAGFLGIETINSMITGGAPLAFVGKTVASIFGFATAEDMQLTKKQLEQHSKAIEDLSVNQKMLIDAHIKVSNDIITLNRLTKQQEYDTSILYAEIDNKVAIYNLQSLLQMTLLKMSHAIAAAIQHNTSPYAFGQADLHNVTMEFRARNIPLTDNINDVFTTLALVDNMYTFIFSAPILNPKNNFLFFEIRDLPIYKAGKQYRLNTQYKYFALNLVANEYAIVTESEYHTCLSLMVCNIAAPFMKITLNSPCEILTFKYNSQHCQMTETNDPMVQFANFDNITYFSIPETMEIQIVCSDRQVQHNEHKTIMGTGQIATFPGCTIQAANDNISIRPGFVASRYSLQSDTLFQILRVPDRAMLFPTTTPFPENVSIPYKFRDISSVDDAFKLIFNQDTTYAEAIRIITYIVIILISLACIYCCFPRCRLWFNGCCFLQKPTKYWRDVKGYEVPDFRSKRRQLEAQELKAITVDDNIEIITSNCNSPRTSKKANAPSQAESMNTDMAAIEAAPYPFNALHKLYNPLLMKTFKQTTRN